MATIRRQGWLAAWTFALVLAVIAPESTALLQPPETRGDPPAAATPPQDSASQLIETSLDAADARDAQKPVCRMCQDWPDVSFNWKLCKPDGSIRHPSRNNLGGQGPNKNDPPEIRYTNVATVRGVSMDLVVTNASAYTPFNISRNVVSDWKHGVGLYGCFGVVNLAPNSHVKLNFGFKPHGQEDFMKFDPPTRFIFSLWDLDNSDRKDNKERFALTSKGLEATKSHASVDELKVMSPAFKEWVSKAVGNGKDNPETDQNGVGKSIEAQYKGVSKWEAGFAVEGGKRGRNFLFHGCRPCP